jgi:outer membrane protein assembly factor BamB
VASRIIERSAMKPAPGKSALDGNLTAGNSTDAASEMLNEMQRSRSGDVVQEDQSRYQVTLRPTGAEAAWTGEVIGPPRLFPLDTVNILAAGKMILVFDRSGKRLWQSSLNFELPGGAGESEEGAASYGQGPCVERNGSLYVFDRGVLTAFDLMTGNARWRLPSVRIAGLFFDDHGMIYVNTTTASPEKIKYSRQIDLSQKANVVVLKVDSKNGRILWNAEQVGLVNYISGKLVLTVQSFQPAEEDSSTPETGFETPPYLRIRRLHAGNGHEMWEHFQQRCPLDIGFEKNLIRLVFKKEVQVLKFLAF